jgi:hypothetical protein
MDDELIHGISSSLSMLASALLLFCSCSALVLLLFCSCSALVLLLLCSCSAAALFCSLSDHLGRGEMGRRKRKLPLHWEGCTLQSGACCSFTCGLGAWVPTSRPPAHAIDTHSHRDTDRRAPEHAHALPLSILSRFLVDHGAVARRAPCVPACRCRAPSVALPKHSPPRSHKETSVGSSQPRLGAAQFPGPRSTMFSPRARVFRQIDWDERLRGCLKKRKRRKKRVQCPPPTELRLPREISREGNGYGNTLSPVPRSLFFPLLNNFIPDLVALLPKRPAAWRNSLLLAPT